MTPSSSSSLVEVSRIKTLDHLGEDSFDRARRWLGVKPAGY